MKLRTLLSLVNKSVKRMETVYPNHKFNSPEGEASIGTVAKEFDLLCKWLQPSEDFDSKDIVKVCRCKDCLWYRKFRKKGSSWVKNTVYLCKMDMKPKDPTFYCKAGTPRRGDDEKS